MRFAGHINMIPIPLMVVAGMCLFFACSKEECESQEGTTVYHDYTALPFASKYVQTIGDSLRLEKTSDSTLMLSFVRGDSLIQIEYLITDDGTTHANERKIN